ncbi:hypothetical protein [Novosphingobium sp. FKTRR1]|uniref:hypothetical protein n=1 Tax=Novosphingobium sp. FKTRR1 TaxID=2879118 RepID=UPI001CF0BB5E|nr:hypothetical protein [Novosphingobium sp. FKTRR1]
MAQPASTGSASGAFEAVLREDLASADRALANAAPIMRHLLRAEDGGIFNDQVLARVRGLFADLAGQLVIALSEAAGHADVQAWAQRANTELADVLTDSAPLLSHFHALAIEWQLAERLHQRGILDPVLSPLLSARLGAADPAQAATANALLAAQARFVQSVRRMQLPLSELPGDLCHIALMTMRAYVGDEAGADGYALIAERTLRSRLDERAGRLALQARLLDGLGGSVATALGIGDAGVGLFATALARGSGLTREAATMALTDAQRPRLGLALRACGLPPSAIAEQFAVLHPDGALPAGLDELSPARAAALLAAHAGTVAAPY